MKLIANDRPEPRLSRISVEYTAFEENKPSLATLLRLCEVEGQIPDDEIPDAPMDADKPTISELQNGVKGRHVV